MRGCATLRTPGSNGAARSFCRTRRCIRLPNGGAGDSVQISARLALTHMRPRAREKSLNFFAFRQQQMSNWPINCCDDLGLPISARSSTIPVPVQARGTGCLYPSHRRTGCPRLWYQNQITGLRSGTLPTPAREKSLNFFAFEQQQMGNWPINCCDGLGLPISGQKFDDTSACSSTHGTGCLYPSHRRDYPSAFATREVIRQTNNVAGSSLGTGWHI
jgi:hypothetical protein